MKLSEDMFKLSEKSYENHSRTESRIKTTITSSENAKVHVLREVNSCQAASTDLFEKLIKLKIDHSKVQEDLMTEVRLFLTIHII